MKRIRRAMVALPLVAVLTFFFGLLPIRADAATAEDLNRSATEALERLYRTNPIASDIAKRSKAILVFPSIIKAGLIFGGAYGEGVLMKNATVVDYYNSVSGSWGLQAGAQSYG